jgi:hypothetical protein
MARNDSKAENQHYVPEMLLRNFARAAGGKEPQVFAFDKSTGGTFCAAVGKVATERRFNDIVVNGDVVASFEGALARVEGEAGAPLLKLLAERHLGALTPAEKNVISFFLAAQLLRAKNIREVHRKLNADIAEKMRRMRGDPQRVRGYRPFANDEEVKLFHLRAVERGVPKLSRLLLATKCWILCQTDARKPFWISDNPVARHNEQDFGPYDNLALGMPGLEIYLPLSSTLLLGLWCPTRRAKVVDPVRDRDRTIERFAATWRKSPHYRPAIDDVILRHCFGAELREPRRLVRSIEEGTPLDSTPENIVFYNWLQLRWAERQVYSCDGNFELAHEILAKDPGYRLPPRMTLS